MTNAIRALQGGAVLAFMLLSTGCIVEQPRENYYDRDHHRYYSEHAWHECHDRDDHCR